MANAADRKVTWMNGGMPDAVRAINTAIEKQWLDPDPKSESAHAFVVLAAHVLAGGSINDRWVAAVTPGKRVSIDEIEAAFHELVRTTRQHEESEGRATEVVPRANGSVLGRCLVCMGLPRGGKTELETLPGVLDDVPDRTRQAFTRVYLQHRGAEYADKPFRRVTFQNRPASYPTDLAAFFEDVTGHSVSHDRHGVTVPDEAVCAL